MKLNDKVYNVLKWVSLIALDAIGTAYESLANIWGFPYGTEVMKTCVVFSILIGALIGLSSYNYNKAKEVATDDEFEEE